MISPSKFKNAISAVGGKLEKHSDDWKARMKYRLFHGAGREPVTILVAIPAYNEEVAIGSVVLRSLKYADDVIVVDDGSTDNTAEVAALAGARVVKHEKNGGYGAAIKTCFDTARKVGVDIMIIIDADGQHSPDDIPKMVEKMVSARSDIVIGSRFVDGNEKNQRIPAYRKFGMKVLDTATAAGSGLNVTDTQSGFRAYSKKAIEHIRIGDGGMGAGSEILIEAADHKLNIAEVPIKVRYDLKGTSSKNPIAHGLSVMRSIVGFASQKQPMLFFGGPGLVMLGLGVLACFEGLRIFDATGEMPFGHLLLGILGITMGIQCVFTGFVLISIKTMNTRLARQRGNVN
ncbi:MAG: glycosyltransferase family 2 protein [Betaproteobacteria bacterium]